VEPRCLCVRFKSGAAPGSQCGVNPISAGHLNVVRADAVKHGARIAPFDDKLRKAALVEQRDVVPRVSTFLAADIKPVLSAVGVHEFWLHFGSGKEAWPLVAGGLCHTRSEGYKLVVEGTAPNISRRSVLAIWPVHIEEKSERFLRAVKKVSPIGLKMSHATDIYIRQLDWRMPVSNPERKRLTYSSRRKNSDGIESAGAEEVFDFWRLTE
jgi:hypothetical protein